MCVCREGGEHGVEELRCGCVGRGRAWRGTVEMCVCGREGRGMEWES